MLMRIMTSVLALMASPWAIAGKPPGGSHTLRVWVIDEANHKIDKNHADIPAFVCIQRRVQAVANPTECIGIRDSQYGLNHGEVVTNPDQHVQGPLAWTKPNGMTGDYYLQAYTSPFK